VTEHVGSYGQSVVALVVTSAALVFGILARLVLVHLAG
jgi:hypothetical protein